MTKPIRAKSSPQRVDGELVKVASTQNQAEAEFVQGLLREEGVPSILRRSPGFDVPDFLAAGPRDVLVPAWAEPTARDVLLQPTPNQMSDVRRASEERAVIDRLQRLTGLLPGLALEAATARREATRLRAENKRLTGRLAEAESRNLVSSPTATNGPT